MKILEKYEYDDDELLKMTKKFVLPEDKPFWTWQMFVSGTLGAMFMFVCGVMR